MWVVYKSFPFSWNESVWVTCLFHRFQESYAYKNLDQSGSQFTACYNNTGSSVQPKERGHEMCQRALQYCCEFHLPWPRTGCSNSRKPHFRPWRLVAVNEEVREVVADLNCCLAEQLASTSVFLERPTHPVSPVVPQSVISLGPEPVTDQARAKEQVEE